MADLITRAIKAWAHDSYRGVMLPAMGATSCRAMRAELSDMADEIATLRAENEALRAQLATARADALEEAAARLFVRNYLIERAEAMGHDTDDDELAESATDIVAGVMKYALLRARQEQ